MRESRVRRAGIAGVVGFVGALLPLLAPAPASAAPPVMIGTPAVSLPWADTRPSAAVVDLTNKAPRHGAITSFRYFAHRPGDVRFVIVEPAAAGHPTRVQWVSPPVAVSGTGAGSYQLAQPVVVAPGAAIGVWWNGQSPFNYGDPGPVTGVTQPMGTPAVGTTLGYDPVVGSRTYGLNATFVPDAFIGTVFFESRPWNGARPTSASHAVGIYNSLPASSPGYCSKQVPALAGASNGAYCGTSSNIGYHASVTLDVFTGGTWSFRLGPDFGAGGALLVDGVPIDFRAHDMWWGGAWTNPSQYFQGAIDLAPGVHVFELYGFEGCCDGAWGAQVQAPGGPWVDIVSNGQTAGALRPQTIVFGSTPPAPARVGDTYAVSATGGASGQPVVLTVAPASAAVCTLAGTSVTFTAVGTCVVHADQAGATGYAAAAQASQTIVVANTTPTFATAPPGVTAEADGPGGAIVTFDAPVAADLEDGDVTATCAPASGSAFAVGSTTVTCTATDAHGAAATTGFTVNVLDTTAPLVFADGATAEAAGPDGAEVSFVAHAVDLVDGVSDATCVPPSGSRFPVGTTSVTCTSTDAHGNGAVPVTVEVHVVDTTAPVIAGTLALGALEATGADGAVVTYEPLGAHDLVDGLLTASCVPASGTVLPLGSSTITCTASDSAGNSSSVSTNVVVQDGSGPSLLLPADLTVEATGPDGTAVAYEATASDVVSGAVDVTCSAASGSTFSIGSTTVTCTAGDASGNVSEGSFAVAVVDTTAPAVSGPVATVAEATGPLGAVVTFAASAVDVVDGALPTTCSPASGAVFAIGTTTVSCGAVDAAGNSASATFAVHVTDTTAPSLSLPMGITNEATGPDGAVVAFAATASDVVSGIVGVACSPAPGSVLPVGDHVVACTAIDTAGNKAVGSFVARVVDTTPPVLHLPEPPTAEATGPDGAAVAYAAAADDLVDGTVAVVCEPPSGSTFALGATTVACTATDGAGNGTSGSFAVTVVDTTPPAAPSLADVVVEATGAGGAVVDFDVADATDVVDLSVSAGCTPASGSQLSLDDHVVTCRYADAAGNETTATFTASVVDTTAPVIPDLEDVTVEAVGPAGAVVTYAVGAAADVVDGDVPTTCAPASGGTFAIGTSVVTCTASDARDNTATTAFAATVRDTTGPVLVVPLATGAEATGPGGAAVTYEVSADDAVDGPRPTACTPPSGAVFAIGSTTVLCSASDVRGNTSTASFGVAVTDTTPPVLDLPDAIVVEATSPDGAAVGFVTSAVDIVDGAVEPTCSAITGATFPLGSSTVTCAAVDARGNRATATFSVLVVDTTAPRVTVPADTTVEATSADGATVVFAASAADLVSGPVTTTCQPPSTSVFPLGTTTVTCEATDGAGNRGVETFTVTVEDTTAPVVTFTGNAGTYDVDDDVAIACAVYDAVTAGLTCDDVAGVGHSFAFGDNERTRSATDLAGNTGTATTTFTVVPTGDGLCAVVRATVSKTGVANSLCVKVRAESHRAFRNEVRAQSGKAVSADDAALLTRISLALG